MRPRPLALFFLFLAASVCAHAQSFNLSTSKTFAPGEKPAIHLYTHDVESLEFRVYRIQDPVKFVENLRELHSFSSGNIGSYGPEYIDERTWLERFHDWKQQLWESIRFFFRRQFSRQARHSIRAKQTALSKSSRIVSEAEFAQIPILNQRQLVARWRQVVPATYVSDNNDLPIEQKLDAGLYLLEATDGHLKAYTLVTVTPMALVTRTSNGQVLAYATDRISGQPMEGVKVDAGFGQKAAASATTDASGMALLPITADKAHEDAFWVVGAKDKAIAVSTPGTWTLSNTWESKYVGYVYTERPVYRPTHTVHWKAIVREHAGNVLTPPKPGNLHVTISDATDKVIFDKQMPVSATGTVAGEMDLPRDAALGYYNIRVGDAPSQVFGSFHVEEYRKPEYRVTVTAGQRRVLQGATMPVTIDSRYFFGEPVANAKVKYRVYHERHYWWGESDDSSDGPGESDGGDNSYVGYADEEAEKTGKLDANGLLTIQVPTQVDEKKHGDYDYVVEAGVTDAANREITGRGRFLATYSTFRVNVEPLSYAVRAGEPARFRVTAMDYDNRPLATRTHVQLVYRHYDRGKVETTPGPAVDVTTDAGGQASGQLPVISPPYSSATLQATATAVQPGTRNPENETYLWIMGVGEQSWGDSSQNTQIVADKKSYAPGETAHLSLISEQPDFYALVLVEGDSLVRRQVLHSEGKTLSFDVPITPESQPNLNISAIFIKNNVLYQASRMLKVPPSQQQLQVEVTPSKEVFQPQQQATYNVTTRDFAGKPVSAEVSVGVVDEAIYSLYPDSNGDIVRALYPQRYSSSQLDSSLDYYFSGSAGEKSPMLAMRANRYRPQLAQVKPGNESKPRVRKAFPDTAYWQPSVHTDANGHATVTLTFPDSLTTWRATARAITTDSKAGSAISRVLVRKNVLVRMGSPRFLLKGDELTLPVIVHNYLDVPKEATISLAVEGLDNVLGNQQKLTIPSKGEVTALWRLRASRVGMAKLTATAITDAESDALEISFPIQPNGVARSIAPSGVLTGNTASVPINFPANTDVAAHSLRIDVSPTIAGSLFSALDYLTSYPYGCTEQTMSSFLPNVIVADTLNKLKVSSDINMEDLHAKMNAGLERLKDYQHQDGGWGWWKEDDSRIYMTAYVVAGLGAAAEVAPVSQDHRYMLNMGSSYLRQQLQQHPRMRPELRASVVYALAMANESDLKAALDAQYERRKDLDPEPLAMTGLAMLRTGDKRASELAALLKSKAQHQGDLVFWSSNYVPTLDTEYSNNAEATAYAVRLLAKVDANDAMLSSAAQWLMLARNSGGWWDSTEQTATALFGLTEYLAATKELTADSSVEVLLNGKSIAQRSFKAGASLTDNTLTLNLDAAQLAPNANNLQIVRKGGGRLYWSARGRYFSTEKKDYQSGSMTLNLTRDYFKLQPVQKDGKVVYMLVPLSGTAQVGDVLAVHEAIGGAPMKYLMLEDPIPAGTEFIKNEDSYTIEKKPGGWYWWYTRSEFRDDRAVFFSTDFNGRQEVFYLIRVVNPGVFQISPAHVEAMYQPNVSASSDALRLEVPQPSTGGPQ
ncbi:alpha-2-macroglobulin family protein [Terriglobus tenax]|uniref:alpha-2-macroglobulin family protein n=1 Tax=Terriglobus tenax TaxID=1111115 RepID=UPI0021E01078|nr:MG2 domain-containing protein [Terriglobus tenax]